MKIAGTYTPKKWEEKPYDVIEGRMKATKATVEFAFTYPFDEHRRDERGDLRYMIAYGATRRVGEADRAMGRKRA